MYVLDKMNREQKQKWIALCKTFEKYIFPGEYRRAERFALRNKAIWKGFKKQVSLPLPF